MVVFRATVVVGSLIGFAMAAVDIKNADSAAAEVAKALLMKRFFMTFNQSTTSNRSHAVSFNCRLAGGSSALGIEPVPPRNASIHASETKRPPSPLTLSLAKRVTPATMAVDTPASMAVGARSLDFAPPSVTFHFPTALGCRRRPTRLAVNARLLIGPR
jgi:hypothetical protein